MNKISNEIMQVYDKIAKIYDQELWSDMQYAPHIDRFLSLLNGKKVIDIGCAMGSFTKYIADKGYDTSGLDISSEMLKIAEAKVKNARFVQMDMTDIKMADKFNGIVAINSLIHIEKSKMLDTLEGFKNLLTNNGKMLLIIQEGEGEKYVTEPFDESITEFLNLYREEEFEKILDTLQLRILHKEKIIDTSGSAPCDAQIIYILEK